MSAITRNVVVRRWGTPQVTSGSVNEAREWEEHGHRVNEKWVYHAPRHEPARPQARIFYWLRYDFVASYVVDVEGRTVRDDPRSLVAGIADRLFVPGAPDVRSR